MNKTLRIGILLYFLLACLGTIWVYNDAFQTAVESDQSAGRVRLAEATSRLRGQLDVYRTLANIFAQDSEIITALEQNEIARVGEKLPNLALTYGISIIDITDPTGNILVSSKERQHTFKPSPNLLQAAQNGRLGYRVAIEGDARLVRFSRIIRNPEFQDLGIVIITVDLAQLEFQWPVIPEPLAFFDYNGTSVSSNRPYMLLVSKTGEPKFPIDAKNNSLGLDLWAYRSASGQTLEVQVMNTDIPLLQMQGSIILDTQDARSIALLRAGLALTLLAAFGLIATIIIQQRRRIALEAQHSRTLKQRVEQRTKQLREAQDELVEASNLAALGRLSAGVSHELNQPLAAIMNFAENGKRFIEKSQHDKVSGNLDLISDQIRRITRIINNLRTFARQETTPLERVNFVEIITSAIEMNKTQLAQSEVEVVTQLPSSPIPVLAGQIRLEQVISNLISNAVDAMQDSKTKTLTLLLSQLSDKAQLVIHDTGSGIREPERVFEPFYSTKELGSSKGLGMGLALSFGLISSFGGEFSCGNHGNGAEFTITLPINEPE